MNCSREKIENTLHTHYTSSSNSKSQREKLLQGSEAMIRTKVSVKGNEGVISGALPKALGRTKLTSLKSKTSYVENCSSKAFQSTQC